MWSPNRRYSHTAYMVISNQRDVDKNLTSHFSRSALWIRGAPSEMIDVLPRFDMVDPTARLSQADRGHLSMGQERKQWCSGVPFYSKIATALWKGMELTSVDVAAWVDLLSYDHFLTSSIIRRKGSQNANEPREMCISTIWAPEPKDRAAIEAHIHKAGINQLRAACKDQRYVITAAPDLAALSALPGATRMRPSFDASEFKLTKPLADNTLPLRKQTVDKWLADDVPEELKCEFRTFLVRQDAVHNPCGKPCDDSPESANQKRKPEAEPSEPQCDTLFCQDRSCAPPPLTPTS